MSDDCQTIELDDFTRQFLSTALSHADDPDHEDYDDLFVPTRSGSSVHISELIVDELPDEVVATAKKSCERFQRLNARALAEADLCVGYSIEAAGGDFFMARNSLGCGFFDRDGLSSALKDWLGEAASNAGPLEFDIYNGGIWLHESIPVTPKASFAIDAPDGLHNDLRTLKTIKVDDPVGNVLLQTAAGVLEELLQTYAPRQDLEVGREAIWPTDWISSASSFSESLSESLEDPVARLRYLDKAELLLHELRISLGGLIVCTGNADHKLTSALRNAHSLVRLAQCHEEERALTLAGAAQSANTLTQRRAAAP